MAPAMHTDTLAPTCQNPECSYVLWQNAHPAVAGIITREDGAVLLTRRGIEPDIGKYDLPGGFLQEDEKPEDGIVREVREELGIETRVKRIIGHEVDGYGDNDYYVLNICFELEVINGEPTAREEIEDIEWISKDTLLSVPLAFNNNEKFLTLWLSQQQK